MNQLVRFAVVAALATPALAADTKITTTKHTDAANMMGQETPAKDSTQTTWLGKDRMRNEDGDTVTIVRTDLKKMFILHTADKTYSSLDLPVDLKKVAPQAAPMLESMATSAKVTLTPTTETKKIKDWNATKYTLITTMQAGPMPLTITSEIWASKDVTVDRAACADLHGAMMSMVPGGSSMTAEYKKIDGFPILTERTVSMMGSDTKSTEEVTAVEMKDAPADAYEVPKDYKEKAFDFMTDNPGGQAGPGGRGRGPGGPGRPGGGPPPGDKPVDPPKVPPKPDPK